MTEENVRVIVRVRPLSQKEINEKSAEIVEIDKSLAKITIKDPNNPNRTNSYSYDSVYDYKSQQTEVFDESVRCLIDDVMQGYNATIFAYGYTGSGKTYTMMGSQDGLIPQSVVKMFDCISDCSGASKGTQFMVYASFYEIYQESIRDLMTDERGLKIRESPQKGVFIEYLSQHTVCTTAQIYDLMVKGNAHRTTAATKMNDTSSRSHSIFVVTVERADTDAAGTTHIRRGRLNLVDLAGSERVDRTGASGERLQEGIKINLSLTMLGKVISSLVKGEKHIPYRDSKLTFLLSDSLGGNAKTLMVAAVSPASSNYEESKSTLVYAANAKKIINKARINEDPKDAYIRQMQDTIAALEAQLREIGGGEDDGADMDENGALTEDGIQQIIKRKRNDQKRADSTQAAAIQQEIQGLYYQLEAKRKKYQLYAEKAEEIRSEIEAAKAQILDREQIESEIDKYQKQLRESRQKLAAQAVEKRRMKQQMLLDEEEKRRYRDELENLSAEIGSDEKNIALLRKKLSMRRYEIEDFSVAAQRELAQEREILECARFEAARMRAVVEEFIPADFLNAIVKSSKLDETSGVWTVGGCVGVAGLYAYSAFY